MSTTPATEILTALARKPMTLTEMAVCLGKEPTTLMPTLRQFALDGTLVLSKDKHSGGLFWGLPGAKKGTDETTEPGAIARTHQKADQTQTHSDARPGPVEILARLAGGTTYRTPKQPRSTSAKTASTLDIAHAIAAAKDRSGAPTDPLGVAMAMAMACQRPFEWPRVQWLGHARVLAHLRSQRQHTGIVDGPYIYRARIALHDAFHAIVTPKRGNLGKAAREARMRRETYRWMLRETCALLEAAANTAAADAVRYLFADEITYAEANGMRAEIFIDDNDAIHVDSTPCSEPINLERLCADIVRRPRRDGILVLRTHNHE